MERVFLSAIEFTFALGAGVAAYAAFQLRDKPAGKPVFLLLTTGCLYAITSGLSSLVTDDAATVAFGLLRWPLGALIGVGVLYTAIEYTSQAWMKRPVVLVSMIAFVLVDATVVFTTGIHELFFSELAVENNLLDPSPGPLFPVHLVLSFLLVGLGLWFLFENFLRNNLYRRQTATIIVGVGIAAGFFVIESLVTVHPGFNLSTVGIVIGSLVLLWAITNAGLLQTVPVARETLMDSMDAFIVAIDEEDRVIDFNQAALGLLEGQDDMLGEPVREVLGDYPEIVEQFSEETDVDTEFSLEENNQLRHFSLTISPITYSSGFRHTDETLVGRLIVVTDVTEQRRREQELGLLKEVFARVLRHNMRNEMNVIKGNASILQSRVEEDHADIATDIVASADEVLELSEKARDLEAIIDSPRTNTAIYAPLAVQRAVDAVQERYPDARVENAMSTEVYVQAHTELETALKNLLENACEHHPSPPATVTVSACAEDDCVEIVVDDDSGGIPDHEVSVIQDQNETTLQHGSGLGLWIVNWVVNRSDASISIETDGDGTTVTLRFDRVEPPDDESSNGPQ